MDHSQPGVCFAMTQLAVVPIRRPNGTDGQHGDHSNSNRDIGVERTEVWHSTSSQVASICSKSEQHLGAGINAATKGFMERLVWKALL
eukprot:365321-Chlamydomonas_euryale.AAC.16